MQIRTILGLSPKPSLVLEFAEPPIEPKPPEPMARYTFAVSQDYFTWQGLVNGTQQVNYIERRLAMQVPAVIRARNLIAGTLSTLPIHSLNNKQEEVYNPLLYQPESLKGYVRSVSIANTIEDLMMEGSSLWMVIQRDSTTGYPVAVEHIPWGVWSQDSTTGVITVNGKEARNEEMILFSSPNPPLLRVGASAITALRILEATSRMYLNTPEANDYFGAVEGQEPDDAVIEEFMDRWNAARKQKATAFVPAGLERKEISRHTGEELQMIQAKEFSILEISRLTGIDATWLSVNVTTRTYLNSESARREYVDYVLSPYIAAIEQRLSLGDVTPRGQHVRINVDGFLRASTKERYEAHKIALEAGFLTVEEVREIEHLPILNKGVQPNA